MARSRPSWLACCLALCALLLIVVCADVLSGATRGDVKKNDLRWWGALLGSPWIPTPIQGTNRSPLAGSLRITLDGDELTAEYTLTAADSAALVRQTLDYPSGQNGDRFVNAFLGTVNISEHLYGVSGGQRFWRRLSFDPPQLLRAGRTTTVRVSSYRFRVDMNRQFLRIDMPEEATGDREDTITVSDADGTIAGPSGASVTQASDLTETLRTASHAAAVSFILNDRHGQNWLLGLRAVGGIALPPALNNLFFRLVKLIPYAVLLWALTSVRDASGKRRPIVVITDAVALIVSAVGAMTLLGLVLDVTFAIVKPSDHDPYQVAAPLGLLAGSVVLLWPVAAWRLGRSTQVPVMRRSLRFVAGAIAVSLALGAVYGLVLDAGFNADLSAGTLTLVALLCVLATVVTVVWLPWATGLGRLRWLVFPGLFAALFASTMAWPLLYAGIFTLYGTSFVNPIGKWLYVLLAVAIVSGLCLITLRVVNAVTTQRWRRRTWTLALVALVCLAILPSSIQNAQLTLPRFTGLIPVDLLDGIDLPDALLQLLDWGLLSLAGLALMLLPGVPPRQAIRRAGIAMLAILLCQGGRWLYLPVSLALGYVTLALIALPAGLARDETERNWLTPTRALRRALTSWLRVDFMASQQQNLVSSSADALRGVLLNNGMRKYRESLNAVAEAQEELAGRHDRLQRSARRIAAAAFDHQGLSPSRRSAIAGLSVGCIWAIVPTLIMILSSAPNPAWTDYPALDFLGNDAWNILLWPFLGWCVGYFLPFIRGRNGVEKALWLYTATMIATLPTEVVVNDGTGWINTLIYSLELFSFLLICSVITCDLLVLTRSGMRISDWTKVHNWRFVVTWSSALLAALGTAVVTFVSTAATDISQQTVTVVTGQTTVPAATTNVSNGHGGQP